MTTIPLPFLRNSERKDFKSCQQQWWWGWNFDNTPGLGLVSKMPRHGALWFGTGWHLVWAEYYTPPPGTNGFTRGREPHETWDEFCKGQYATVSSQENWGDEAEKEWFDAVALGHIMIDGYLAHYKGDPSWEVLMPEQRFSARIPYNARQLAFGDPASDNPRFAHWVNGKFITNIVGTFDMPIRNHGWDQPRVEIVDHKTTGKKMDTRSLVKDDQGGTYIAVGTGYLRKHGLIHGDESIEGAIWNYARKGKPPEADTTDDQGRVRNQPQKVHYLSAILGISTDFIGKVTQKDLKANERLSVEQTDAAIALSKMTIEQLGLKAKDMGLPKVMGAISLKQPGALFWRESVDRGKENRLHQISRIADDAEQIALLRGGIVAPSKNPGDHCNWCPYNDLCDLDENGDDTSHYIPSVYNTEDRYADHREGAENSKSSVSNKKATGTT